MLHTRIVDCRMIAYTRQLIPECLISCDRYTKELLCIGCSHWNPALVIELAKRISATTGQENGQENNRRNIKQF